MRAPGRKTAKSFNTAGPIVAGKHYHVPPLSRVDLEELLYLIDDWRYFVLHAPRQTGKTTLLGALEILLNESGAYRCVYVNVEAAQMARSNVRRGVWSILARLGREAERATGDDTVKRLWPEALQRESPEVVLESVLSEWAGADPGKPVVLLMDEIDALVGDTLVSVLRQLRSGYRDRPERFPQSVVLCGVRDVRDYRIYVTADDQMVLGGSAFNVKAESLRLGSFSEEETRGLLLQHTEETGQEFTESALHEIWRASGGQPWLVNALAYQACFAKGGVRDRSVTIGERDVITARERLILRRDTHLDQLAHKLGEARVRRVIEPVLTGGRTPEPPREEDLDYVRDLGLVTDDGSAIANPIYREVIPRQLSYLAQTEIQHSQSWYVSPDGRLCMSELMRAFQSFYRENADHWMERYEYKEAAPQLLLQAFLQRVVNAGGRIEREYAVGRRRMDLAVIWEVEEARGGVPGAGEQRVVVECKVVRGPAESVMAEGLKQTAAYMELWKAGEGHLVLVDRSRDAGWNEKIYDKVFGADGAFGGRTITVWGM